MAVLPPLPPRKRADDPLNTSPNGPYIPPKPGSKEKNPATNKKSEVDQVLHPVERDGWWSNVRSRVWGLPMTNALLNSTQQLHEVPRRTHKAYSPHCTDSQFIPEALSQSQQSPLLVQTELCTLLDSAQKSLLRCTCIY